MKITIRPAIKLPQIIIHRKVAAYCRVSTQQEIQHHSLEAQLCCAVHRKGLVCILLRRSKIEVSPPSSWRRPSCPRQLGFDYSSPFLARRIKDAVDCIIHCVFYWYTGRDSNPQPSEPESDALSIEPPVHLR